MFAYLFYGVSPTERTRDFALAVALALIILVAEWIFATEAERRASTRDQEFLKALQDLQAAVETRSELRSEAQA